jgi:hypothetical protein
VPGVGVGYNPCLLLAIIRAWLMTIIRAWLLPLCVNLPAVGYNPCLLCACCVGYNPCLAAAGACQSICLLFDPGSEDSERPAWDAVLPRVRELKQFYEFSLALEAHVPRVLEALGGACVARLGAVLARYMAGCWCQCGWLLVSMWLAAWLCLVAGRLALFGGWPFGSVWWMALLGSAVWLAVLARWCGWLFWLGGVDGLLAACLNVAGRLALFGGWPFGSVWWMALFGSVVWLAVLARWCGWLAGCLAVLARYGWLLVSMWLAVWLGGVNGRLACWLPCCVAACLAARLNVAGWLSSCSLAPAVFGSVWLP